MWNKQRVKNMEMVHQNIMFLGFIVMFIGMILIVVGGMLGASETKVESTGVILIGPFPIVWGSNSRLIIPVLVLTIILIFTAWLMLNSFR